MLYPRLRCLTLTESFKSFTHHFRDFKVNYLIMFLNNQAIHAYINAKKQSLFPSSSANDLPSLMEEARLLKLQAQVYQRSGNAEETLKTVTRAKEVQTR